MSSAATLPQAWSQGSLSPVVIIDDETKRLLERIAVALEALVPKS